MTTTIAGKPITKTIDEVNMISVSEFQKGLSNPNDYKELYKTISTWCKENNATFYSKTSNKFSYTEASYKAKCNGHRLVVFECVTI